MEDLFNDLDDQKPAAAHQNDTALGDEFVDLDDGNDNDFAVQRNKEQNVGRAASANDPGNLDAQKDYNPEGGNPYDYLNLDEGSLYDDNELDGDDFAIPGQTAQNSAPAAQTAPAGQSAATDDKDDGEGDSTLLGTINAKYGKNFKTEKELQDFLSGVDNAEAAPKDPVTAEERQQYDQNKSVIDFYQQLVQKDDESIVRSYERMEFHNRNNRKANEDELGEIDEIVENYKSSGTLRINADHLRAKFSNTISNLKGYNDGIDNKVNETKTAHVKQNQLNLKNSLREIYLQNQGKILGVAVNKDDLQTAYNDGTSGEFVKQLMSDPKRMAKLALINRKLDLIEKASMNPNYSTAVDNLLKGNTQNGRRLGSVQSPGQGQIVGNGRMTSDEGFAK